MMIQEQPPPKPELQPHPIVLTPFPLFFTILWHRGTMCYSYEKKLDCISFKVMLSLL